MSRVRHRRVVVRRKRRRILEVLPTDPVSLFQDRSVGFARDPVAVLLAMLPEAIEAPAVLPGEGAESVLLIVGVLALKRAAVRPGVSAAAVDHSLVP